MRSSLLLAGLLMYGIVLAQTTPQTQQFKVHQLDKTHRTNVWIAEPPSDHKKQLAYDTLRLIVRLADDLSTTPGGRQDRRSIQEQHARFKDDLSRISGNAPSGRASSMPTTIHYEYIRTFNGFAITTSRTVADDIRELPYVAAVTEDKKVEASYSDNKEIIRAPQVWQDFGVTGKNITIGILDTGIDYNHPDLGQGFGTGYKVAGGYDFVNDDSDPMDDHGHGTHVAGIAAANGLTFKGVAPDATLFAYKVLNIHGYGYDSWILAGIERCVDPDQNPATDDALDVVNMSLGRPPDPLEPLSMAVNNAIAQGVVFCIAAGNRGDYLTIDAPGTAENAITVGATDNYLQTAPFSSKGPTENFQLKPDVSAPGSDIHSTHLNQQYQSFSGTSMATPHVAGAAALLLEKKPHFTPAMVKSALMGTARAVAPVIWDQGAGVIDIYEAINASYFAAPASIHFGIADSLTFHETTTLTVTNNDNVTRSFDLSVDGLIVQAPFTFNIAPASFSLGAHESMTVDLTLSATTPVSPQNLPGAYQGTIHIRSDNKTVKTSAVVMNPQKTVLNFDGPPPNSVIVIGIDGSFFWRPYYPQPEQTALNLFLPKARYDILAQYDGAMRTVITEGVSTDNNVSITLSRSQAKNILAFKPLDPEGNPIDLTNYTSGNAFFSGENRNIITSFPWAVDTLYVSDTEHYRYEFKYNAKAATGYEYLEIVAGTGTGIHESKVCSNDPSAFSNITIHNPSIAPDGSQHMTFYVKCGSPYSWFTSWNSYPIEMPATFTLIQTQHQPMPPTQQLPPTGYLGSFATFSPLPEQSGYVWETADIRAEDGNTISFNQHIDRKIVTVEQKDMDYVLGRTIPNFVMIPAHQSGVLRYYTFLGRGAFNRGLGERERGNVQYKLYKDASVIKQGIISQSINHESGSYLPDIEISPGTYHLDFQYSDFQTGGQFGIARFSTVFNSQGSDPNPPYIKSLRLLVNGRDTNEFQEGEKALLKFVILDCDWCSNSPLKTVSASVRKQADNSEWIALTVQASADNQFSAELPSTLPAGYYSLLLTAEDPAGNKFTYDVAPAFLIGERVQPQAYTTINLVYPKNYSRSAGTSPVFRWTPLDGASTYDIQIADTPEFTGSIREGNATDASYMLENPLEENRTYYWRVREHTSVRWSSVYQFESRFLPTAELLIPAHESVIPASLVEFRWSMVPEAYRYIIEVSRSEDFSLIDRVDYTMGTSALMSALTPNNQYYWRIRSFFFSGWSDEEESLSPPSQFTTEALAAPALRLPVHESVDQPTGVMFQWDSSAEATAYYFELGSDESLTAPFQSVITQDTSIWIEHLQHDTRYFWRVTPDFYGQRQAPSGINSFRTATITGIEDSAEGSTAFGSPNPFAEGTNIVLQSAHDGAADVQITDPLGRKIASMYWTLSQGQNILHWDGRADHQQQPGAGVYYATIVRQGRPPLVIRLVRIR